MELQTLTVDGRVRVIARGELDLATAQRMQDELLLQLALGDVRLDLREVSFIDSTGLRALLLAQRTAEASGREMVLRPSPEVQRVLDLAGLEGHFALLS